MVNKHTVYSVNLSRVNNALITASTNNKPTSLKSIYIYELLDFCLQNFN